MTVLKHRSLSPGAKSFSCLVLAVSLASGCVTTTSLERPGDLATLRDPPGRLAVRTAGDSAWLPIVNYRATRDSLLGIIEGSAPPGYPLKRLETPYDSLAEVRVKRADPGRTALIPTVPAVLLGFAYWILGAP
jgi:hypothetical protein